MGCLLPLAQPFIEKIVGEVDKGKRLYTPFHLPNHWVVICADKEKKELSYGEWMKCSGGLFESQPCDLQATQMSQKMFILGLQGTR